MVVAKAFQELGAGRFWRREAVGRRESVAGHRDVVVQGVDVGVVRSRQRFCGGVVEG